jgi:thymidylate synthase (FAD)
MSVKLQWATPDIDKQIMYMARVSNPENQNSEKTRLLHYCMEQGHVSPFEMANACVEIDTTRDIARQILRHRSFSFQEFSQRYADATLLGDMQPRECRLQDTKNRQNSIELDITVGQDIRQVNWNSDQAQVWGVAVTAYKHALEQGIAKEVARALLPEGLTPSRLYMNGNMRSWIFYLKQRLHPSTQKEHRVLAQEILSCLRPVAPVTMAAFFPTQEA